MLKVKTKRTRTRATSTPVPTVALPGFRVQALPPDLEGDVRELYRICHPKWPEPPGPHFFAYPTVVAIADYPHNVVGYAQYAMNLDDAGHISVWLKDTCVAPEARGHGVARALMLERLRIGFEMGAVAALGMTQPENAPMLGLLRSLHFDEREHFQHAYPAGEDGIFFGLSLATYRKGV